MSANGEWSGMNVKKEKKDKIYYIVNIALIATDMYLII